MKRTFTVIRGSKLTGSVIEHRTVMSKAQDKVRFNQQFIAEAEKVARERSEGCPWGYYRELDKALSA